MEMSDFQWSDIITKVVAAAVILVITWLLAKFAKKILTQQFTKIKALNSAGRHG